MRGNYCKGRSILVLHTVLPLLAGGLLYWFFSPEVLFVQAIDSLLGIRHFSYSFNADNLFFTLIRNYFLDGLWAYSLYCILKLIIDNSKIQLTVAILGAVTMESVQLIPSVPGTYDIWDIVIEIIGITLAFAVTKRIYVGVKQNEKETN